MVSGFYDGNDTPIASKLQEAFTIIFICLPQDFVMDSQLAVRREASQEMGIGPSGPVPQAGFKTP
jgi:hypothetical protein